jgi:GT2 family glycosyltransferase
VSPNLSLAAAKAPHPKIGVVVPTLGTRSEYLRECLLSIREQGLAYILLVAPNSFDSEEAKKTGLVDQVLTDPKTGLAGAINLGLEALPASCEFVTWLGDDDRLVADSLHTALQRLGQADRPTAVFGACEYIDENGRVFWTNKSGSYAVKLLRVGPNRLPQPGSLVRRSALEIVGNLDVTLGWAFDQDMFIKLSRIGKVVHVKKVLAQFRWHDESLSAGQSSKSVEEASTVRSRYVHNWLKLPFSLLERVHLSLASKRVASLDRRVKN